MHSKLVFCAVVLACVALVRADVSFSITYPKESFVGPFSGRAVVYLSKASEQPRRGPNWFSPEPCYSAFFKNVMPGEAIVISDANAIGFPGKLSALPAGEWKVQVVLDRNLGGREIGASPGNLYSVTKTVTIGESGGAEEFGFLAETQRRQDLQGITPPSVRFAHSSLPNGEGLGFAIQNPQSQFRNLDTPPSVRYAHSSLPNGEGWEFARLVASAGTPPSVRFAHSSLPNGEGWDWDITDHIGAAQTFFRVKPNLRFEISKPGNRNQVVQILCDQVVPERKFNERPNVKEAKIQSKLLSAFYGRPTFIAAAVVLPEAWSAETERKFPVIYEVPGFGGNHYIGGGGSRTMRDAEPFIYVVLDPDCPTGHCVFADSANNGPWGAALTTELIPYIESTYRAIGKPEARFVTGHSSGGWSSLWLQVAYPDFFGGVWSTSPDPVDFRDFQMIDLYKPGNNMFTDEKGNPRPIARMGDKPFIFYKPFSDMERPIRGEQLGSFEAVFSPKGPDGEPMKLWDRDTGAIDPKVAEAWKKYDITLILKNNWKTLGPKLAGKIHVYMGDKDTFYLEGATKLLQSELKALGSDGVVEIVPGDHGSMMTSELRARIDREMAAQFRKTGTPHPSSLRSQSLSLKGRGERLPPGIFKLNGNEKGQEGRDQKAHGFSP